MTPEEKAIIVDVLCGQALADHLGDVRDAEGQLWSLLGVEDPVLDYDSAWQNTKATLTRNGIPLPTYLQDDD